MVFQSEKMFSAPLSFTNTLLATIGLSALESIDDAPIIPWLEGKHILPAMHYPQMAASDQEYLTEYFLPMARELSDMTGIAFYWFD